MTVIRETVTDHFQLSCLAVNHDVLRFQAHELGLVVLRHFLFLAPW
eukprot:COSAG01_NODE_57008_length_315_cov_0.666667_2_plen_45_part_01